jgi:hypothetical protein
MSDGDDGDDGDDTDEIPRVRVRGIYATALTARLREAGLDVVQASEPIRERFDAEFPPRPADAAIATTGDRQGIGVSGTEAAVDAVDGTLRDGLDTLVWPDERAPGVVFDGRVTETLGGGAVVDLGPGKGYLPYDDYDGYVDDDDAVRVQVREGSAPWTGGRPELSGDLRAGDDDGLVELRPGGAAGGASLELADVLPVDPPDGWGARWHPRADDAGLDALGAALRRTAERAGTLDALPDAVEPPRRLTDVRTQRWVWFGRTSRFDLDTDRRAVTATMPGHHRIKAGSRAASAAVDFTEAVCSPGGEFPFGVVRRQFGPREGDAIELAHGKPDGRCLSLGHGRVTAADGEGVTVEREMSPGGSYDALGIDRQAGDVAVTKLKEGRWWYPTVYRNADGERRGTYVNVCTPVELFPETVRYVDLHVDVVRHDYADGSVERVDDDELDAAVDDGHVPEPLAEKARSVATAVENALSN